MSHFVEQRLPTDIAFGSTGGPEFKTLVIQNQSGHEIRQIYYDSAIHTYHLNFTAKNQQQISKLLAFFHNMLGQAVGFRFKDWGDYQISNQQIAIADGTNCQFQIHKTYPLGNTNIKRIIKKPVDGTLKIKNFAASLYECDFTCGQINFKQPPKAGIPIVVDVEFDTPVRFAADKIEVKVASKDLREIMPIKLVEVKI